MSEFLKAAPPAPKPIGSERTLDLVFPTPLLNNNTMPKDGVAYENSMQFRGGGRAVTLNEVGTGEKFHGIYRGRRVLRLEPANGGTVYPNLALTPVLEQPKGDSEPDAFACWSVRATWAITPFTAAPTRDVGLTLMLDQPTGLVNLYAANFTRGIGVIMGTGVLVNSWRLVARNLDGGGMASMDRDLNWPVPVDDFCRVELRMIGATRTRPAQFKVFLNGALAWMDDKWGTVGSVLPRYDKGAGQQVGFVPMLRNEHNSGARQIVHFSEFRIIAAPTEAALE